MNCPYRIYSTIGLIWITSLRGIPLLFEFFKKYLAKNEGIKKNGFLYLCYIQFLLGEVLYLLMI